MEETKKKNKKKKKSSTLPLILLMAAGLMIMLYPVISNIYNEMTGSYAIQEFNDQMAGQNEISLDEQRARAEVYNNSLISTGTVLDCPYKYEDIMDFGNGMMGYIQIPAIDVHLPVYHGISENILSKAVGHVPRSAFPIGGEGNHSVLTGHTGLPSAELFTDLDQMVIGDTFYIHVLEEVLAYEVDQIIVVLPEEVDNIQPVAGEDYCTLVTCTPYGINSHRLLVRGHRVENISSVVIEEPETGVYWKAGLAGVVAVLLIAVLLYTRKIGKKKNDVNSAAEMEQEIIDIAAEAERDSSTSGEQ